MRARASPCPDAVESCQASRGAACDKSMARHSGPSLLNDQQAGSRDQRMERSWIYRGFELCITQAKVPQPKRLVKCKAVAGDDCPCRPYCRGFAAGCRLQVTGSPTTDGETRAVGGGAADTECDTRRQERADRRASDQGHVALVSMVASMMAHEWTAQQPGRGRGG